MGQRETRDSTTPNAYSPVMMSFKANRGLSDSGKQVIYYYNRKQRAPVPHSLNSL